MRIHIDFETRSTADLRQVGVYRYAEDLLTDIVCMAWAVDDEEPEIWTLGTPFPAPLAQQIADGAELHAWNAQFERVIWNVVGRRYGWPATTRRQWYDTAADAAAMALPRALGECARVLKVTEQKDDPGYLFVLRMAKPRSRRGKQLVWWTDPERLQRLYDYCLQDVRTERAIHHATRRLGPRERQVYLLDQEMNDRGVLVDAPLARQMHALSKRALAEANGALAEVTGGAVTRVTKPLDLRQWLGEQGVEVESTRKAVVRDLLASEDLSPMVRAALEVRREAGKSSVAKLVKALSAACRDGRLRGLLLYHGANTGRWAGKGIQPQNFPRGDFDYLPYLDLLQAGDYEALDLLEPVLVVIAAALRGLFIAQPGHRLLVGDFAQIEARVLAWLAQQKDQLALFRAGQSPYPPMAERIYGLPRGTITSKLDDRYKMGKDTVLGCGYGMGADKFRQQILEKTGVDVGQEMAERAVRIYRASMTAVTALWHDLETTAFTAVEQPGTTVWHRGCGFSVRGAYLWLVLPSGRPLAYAAPKIEHRRVPWHNQTCRYTEETDTWDCGTHEYRPCVTSWCVDSRTRRWSKRSMYGGLWTENIVQALARDMMVDAMLRLRAAGYPLTLTVHDEIVAERALGSGTLEEFVALAKTTAPWAVGCPVDFEAWEGDRYRK